MYTASAVRLPVRTVTAAALLSALPFNLLKGLVISGVTMMVYKRLRPILKGQF